MALDESTTQGVRYLLGLVEEQTARRICDRLRIELAGEVGPVSGAQPDLKVRRLLDAAPQSVLLWMLQSDDPRVNALLYGANYLPLGLRRDILTGVSFASVGERPFSSAVRARLQVIRLASADAEEYRQAVTDVSPEAIITALYQAGSERSLRRARVAAERIRTRQWPDFARAHREDPFPGFARWAIAERVDCPAELRQEFGSHARFRHRLRQAGIVDGPAEYVDATAPAKDVLPVLGFGRWGYPGRLAEAEAALLPLVRAELGGHAKAWAVLAQLLPEFVGTLPELIATAGAVAGPAPLEHAV